MKRPFEIGERVVFTTKDGRKLRGSIAKINLGSLRLALDNYATQIIVGFDKVRRLKPKKEPREWQLLIRKDGSFASVHSIQARIGVIRKNFELIRVREVL